MTYEIPYSFFGGVRDGLLCRDPEVVLAGPADTGKTLACLYKLHNCANKYGGAQFSIIRKVKSDLEGTALRTFKRDFLEPHAPYVSIYGGHRPEWFDYPNGSRIWVGGLDKPGKTLSAERDIVYVNQCEQISLTDWEYLTRVVTGRGAVMPYTQLVGDCNPASHTHWILSRRDQKRLSFFEATHKDNPQLWDHKSVGWTEQGKRRLDRLRNLTGTRYQRLYLGLWAPPEGAIYDVFDEDRHKVKSFPIPQLWPRFVGVDPFGAQIAALWVAFDIQNQVLNVYREYVAPFGITTPDHVKAILKMTQGARETIFAWVGGGPSERQWRTDWTGAGIPLLEPPITDVWAGIDRVYNLLKDFKLVIHDCCVNLLSEIGDYRRKLGRDGTPTESIENTNDFHCLDAARYIVSWLSQPATQRTVVNRAVAIGPRW